MSGDTPDLADAQASVGPAANAWAATAPAEDFVVRQSIEPGDLRRLFDCLVQESCVHSWRNIGPQGQASLEELLAWENQRRPTELFFFYVERRGQLQLVAASAVADRLTRDFPHPGFCVLSRCYIMPEFRGQGFYRRILHYRLEHCRARFGDLLRGIHIGTVDQRIACAITRPAMPSWPRFIHLGEEELRVAGQVRTVGDYILLVPAYVRRLQQALAGADAPPCVLELRERLATIDSAAIDNLGIFVKRRFDQARAHGWFDDHDPHDLEQLLLFCSAIPLVGFSEHEVGHG